MKVTEKDVLYVADLGNLELTGDERARMLRDLNSILEYIDRLNQLDTRDIPPMAQVSAGAEQKTGSEKFLYATRPDQTRPSVPRERALQNAPDTDGTFFKVPKVIEK